jgi:hypothetical protein
MTLAATGLLAIISTGQAAPRVALLDFSTEDNSYRSIQAAADFTSLLQAQFKGDSSVEWVERSQINLARTEFAWAETLGAGGASPVRRGRMLGANWLVKGHFATDDEERRTLSFHILDLEHADVLACKTILLPTAEGGGTIYGGKQAKAAATALRQLLTNTKQSTTKTNEARVAFLFLANVNGSFPMHDQNGIEPEFREALEQAAATNSLFRLVEFPKAYQATDEREMLVDGIIEASGDSWRQTADLYVWGTSSVSNKAAGDRREQTLRVTLNLWDGASAPLVVDEALPFGSGGVRPAVEVSALLQRLVKKVTESARPHQATVNSEPVRRQIADSIVRAHAAMNGRLGSSGPDEGEQLAQGVRMLETACFFDPDNADARVLWVTSRYGWWIDFDHDVQNEFWTKWRRSQAWKNYIERFGTRPLTVRLPFPYQSRDVFQSCIEALDDVVAVFPQWHSKEEMDLDDQWRKEGTHTWLVEAEAHGFPKEMPHELAFRWRTELEKELAQMKQKVANGAAAKTNAAPPVAAKPPVKPQAVGATGLSAASPAKSSVAVTPPSTRPNPNQMVPAPAWLRNSMSIHGMFRLYPPLFPTGELKPTVQKIEFPARYEVQEVKQLAWRDGRLWILAMDERASPSSEAKPDLADETRSERNRLWCLDADNLKPTLYESGSIPTDIEFFLFRSEQMWLAGNTVSVWDLKQSRLRKFGLNDGLAMKEPEALAITGTRVFAAGGSFEIAVFDPATSRWSAMNRPVSQLSHGTGYPFLLAGNEQALAYVAGELWFYNLTTKAWTNAPAVKEARCFAVEGPTFWTGADNGLHAYDSATRSTRSWNSPSFLESPMNSMGGGFGGGGSTISQRQVEDCEAQIQGRLRKLQLEHRRSCVTRLKGNEITDPLHLNSRIPGQVRATVNDGDYLWLGTDNYFGSRLLLVHKPSHSLVAALAMQPRNTISSLGVSDQHVWIGTYYGDDHLLRVSKEEFLAVPKSQWKDLTLAPDERAALIKDLNRRDQALYAFLAGDGERVFELLSDADPRKASLEEMLLLVWSCGLLGANNPQQMEAWAGHLNERQPDSPWAKSAAEAMKENQSLLDKFDANHDHKLDAGEKTRMLADEESLGIQNNSNKNLEAHLDVIFKTCDQDADGKLNRLEAQQLWTTIPLYFAVDRELMPLRIRADANRDSYLDTGEFIIVIGEVRRITNERNKRQQRRRQVRRRRVAADLTEQVAAKTALLKAAIELAERGSPKLVK